MELFKVLDRRYGFSREIINAIIGKGVVLGDENDWKKNVTNTYLSDCANEIGLKVGPSAECNPDARNLANCYWKKMFDACPVRLGGGTCSFK